MGTLLIFTNLAAVPDYSSEPPSLAALPHLGSAPHRETFAMNSDEARQRAEKGFKHEEPGRVQKPVTEYEAQAIAIREKSARLKTLRLAKEAQSKNSRSDG
jgi:hypothetical protein